MFHTASRAYGDQDCVRAAGCLRHSSSAEVKWKRRRPTRSGVISALFQRERRARPTASLAQTPPSHPGAVPEHAVEQNTLCNSLDGLSSRLRRSKVHRRKLFDEIQMLTCVPLTF